MTPAGKLCGDCLIGGRSLACGLPQASGFASPYGSMSNGVMLGGDFLANEETAVKVRCGASRTVWLFGKWALKVPSRGQFPLGWHSNRRERERWGWSTDAEKRLLCPVVWSFFGDMLLVMRRAEEISEPELPLPSPLLYFTRDVHWQNVGRLEGRLVLLDYA